ncbi:ATP-binding protein [Streptomyces tendae]|uniref:ATP-binding protein n=1 Tax=Streptomyces tendae TaxID=1932 RepID=UPI003D761B81
MVPESNAFSHEPTESTVVQFAQPADPGQDDTGGEPVEGHYVPVTPIRPGINPLSLPPLLEVAARHLVRLPDDEKGREEWDRVIDGVPFEHRPAFDAALEYWARVEADPETLAQQRAEEQADRIADREAGTELHRQRKAERRAAEYEPAGRDVFDFLGDDAEDTPDWVVPGLLERQDRIIVTGLEGSGKSVLGRQVGVCAACGIHPFDLTRFGIQPIRVMIIDLENPTKLVRRNIRDLVDRAGGRLAPGMLHVVSRPDGMNLVGNDGAELRAELDAFGDVDLVVIGPLYKMVTEGDVTEEPVARELTATLDRLRIEYGFALFIEAHAPHQTGATSDPKKMTTRPYGASLFKRWPEFGYFLHYDEESGAGELLRWRKDRQPDRSWPALLRRGGKWPWTVPASEADEQWARYRAAAEELAQQNRGAAPSRQKLANRLEVSKTTVNRMIDDRRGDWDRLCAELLERYGPAPKVTPGQGVLDQQEGR